MNQYFIYGVLVSLDTYLEAQSRYDSVDKLNQDEEDIRGVFTGRNGDFMIVGKILRTLDTKNKEPLVVPELDAVDEHIIKNIVTERYGFEGEFHYYFIRT